MGSWALLPLVTPGTVRPDAGLTSAQLSNQVPGSPSLQWSSADRSGRRAAWCFRARGGLRLVDGSQSSVLWDAYVVLHELHFQCFCLLLLAWQVSISTLDKL